MGGLQGLEKGVGGGEEDCFRRKIGAGRVFRESVWIRLRFGDVLSITRNGKWNAVGSLGAVQVHCIGVRFHSSWIWSERGEGRIALATT